MGLEQYIIGFIGFVNNIVIPFLLGIAFLFFVINVFRFFILGGANTDSQEKARSLAIYGVGAFVLISILWGIINILTSSLGLAQLGQTTARCFDYDPNCDLSVAVPINNTGTPSESENDGPVVEITPPTQETPGENDIPDGPGPLPEPEEDGPVVTTPDQPDTPALPGPPPIQPGTVVERVEEFADNFEPPEYFGERFIPTIQATVAPVADRDADIEARAQAAILLEMHNRITDEELSTYIAFLNSEKAQTNDPTELDMVTIQAQATQDPPILITEIQQTQRQMFDLLVEENRGFLDFGEPNQAARDATIAQLTELYANEAGLDRTEAFDQLYAQYYDIMTPEVIAIRNRMIEEGYVERLYDGIRPRQEGN